AHLVPWFALAAGVMLRDGLDAFGRIRFAPRPHARLLYTTATVAVMFAVLAYSFMLLKQYKRYYRGLRSPNLVTFSEYETTLRELVPEGLCPVVERVPPAIWLAFPEKDSCFADIEKR